MKEFESCVHFVVQPHLWDNVRIGPLPTTNKVEMRELFQTTTNNT